MACCFDCILQSGGGSGLSAQIGALQQSWRANAPADFARVKFWAGAVAVRYAHLAATAINMRTGGGKCAFVGLSECRGRALVFNQDAAGTLIDSKRRPSAQKEDRTDETYNSSS